MKKLLLFSIIIILTVIFSIPAAAQSWTDWGRWTNSSCYKGLDFRVKTKYDSYSGKYEVKVDFRNRYYEKIWFTFEVSGGSYTSSNNRTDVNGSDSKDLYVGSSFTSSQIYITINKVRFVKDGLQEYYRCDQ